MDDLQNYYGIEVCLCEGDYCNATATCTLSIGLTVLTTASLIATMPYVLILVNISALLKNLIIN